ncbi:MAG: hypothetical protein PHE95_02870 [Candidatus Methanomethylophilus sp.]|nr:hypothetical protein [Methanomethylophilus sp.]
MKVTVKNTADGSTLVMEIEPFESVEEILVSAAEYWNKGAGAYVLRRGSRLLSRQQTAAEAGLADGDAVEIVPDPEGG